MILRLAATLGSALTGIGVTIPSLMRIILLIASAILGVSACSVDPGQVPDVQRPDLATVNLETDGAVLQAVLDKMIRPEASRLGTAPAAVVVALDSTVPVCLPSTPLGNPPGCIRNWHLEALADLLSPPGARMFDGLLTPIQRVQLASALLKRNEGSHPIPVGAITNATMVAPRDIEGQRPRLDVTRGVVSFSAPAYGGDRHALVYAAYRCGELCGHGWFVLLERRPGGWDVVGHWGLWVS